ncbi:hypothetical protein [Stutzerimonas urumqiensis]|uniref:hypothetical protein n=1 Tax=Stutzerimonas urumqiensis TaxID=638269 RepID=UPI000EB023E1|nr:hypothetical protein [Stutzerimonas urumqiensis]
MTPDEIAKYNLDRIRRSSTRTGLDCAWDAALGAAWTLKQLGLIDMVRWRAVINQIDEVGEQMSKELERMPEAERQLRQGDNTLVATNMRTAS